jgi:adenylyltransferase/sulfurtransferase
VITELVAYDQVCAPAPAGQTSGRDMTASELKAWQASGRRHVLVDVREPREHAAGAIDGDVLIPLGQLADRVDELPAGTPIVAYCQGGGRSARAVALLRELGREAHNLVGGYVGWRA